MLAGPPGRRVHVPRAIAELAGRAELEAVWINEAGGVTFGVGHGRDRRFVKWTPHESGIDLAREKPRLSWASRFVAVPRVLGEGSDEQGSWLILSAIDGENAVAARWLADPGKAASAIGRGLRMLHERLPARACPFSWSAQERVADAQRRAGQGLIDSQSWHPEHRHLSVDAALELVADPPAVSRLVVCHGDACAPNTLLDVAGRVVGHVDLGSLGLADHWADLAVACWSTCWNYGDGWEQQLLCAYGVDPDPGRLAYYRLLWDLDP